MTPLATLVVARPRVRRAFGPAAGRVLRRVVVRIGGATIFVLRGAILAGPRRSVWSPVENGLIASALQLLAADMARSFTDAATGYGATELQSPLEAGHSTIALHEGLQAKIH